MSFVEVTFWVCNVCGGDGDRCRRAWKSQRKCCPDCSHRPKLGVVDAER
ncbi:hypothetical protein PQB71_gp66 [Mycobacterium phage Taptic]|uniref:Uncharacterized protein n=1 Tax=Mycobacterium phage Taptic TaxID=1920305 RepID=A0A1J0MDU2_9CAUD|nr:hypothetical protein PQB71_gp66 [Mycobacterium phage Taptic]APD19296.1 hypothetical protein SEA_TAPTIC_66 [Mycobacterium phage Taptic]